MTKTRRTKKVDVLTQYANSLTSEQYIALLDAIHPIEEEYRNLSDDELLAALTER